VTATTNRRRPLLLAGCALTALACCAVAAEAALEGPADGVSTSPGPAPVPLKPALNPPVIQPQAPPAPAAKDQPMLPTLPGQRRDVTIVLPLKDGDVYLGDVDVTIGVNGVVSFSTQQFLGLLKEAVSADSLRTISAALGARETTTPEQATAAGQPVVYDAALLELRLQVAPTSTAR
jgi:hypothetical protein